MFMSDLSCQLMDSCDNPPIKVDLGWLDSTYGGGSVAMMVAWSFLGDQQEAKARAMLSEITL